MTEAVIIRTCGNLSAKRPGRATRKQPLPAERLRRGAFLISRHAGRRLARRDLVAGIVSRVRSGSDAGALNHGRSAPLNFSGSARVQLRQKSHSRSAQTLHFLTSIGRSFHETKDRREDRSCRTPYGANPPHLRTSA